MKKVYYVFFIMIMSVSFVCLMNNITQAQTNQKRVTHVQSYRNHVPQETITQETITQESTTSQQRMLGYLMKEMPDVIDLKNGKKIIGRVVGSTPNATFVFNIEKCEDEKILIKNISSIRKPASDELKSFVSEIIDQGREDAVIDCLESRKETTSGKSKEEYDVEVRSAQKAKSYVEKQIERAKDKEDEDEWRRSGHGKYIKIDHHVQGQ